jgi:hypothetical protein
VRLDNYCGRDKRPTENHKSCDEKRTWHDSYGEMSVKSSTSDGVNVKRPQEEDLYHGEDNAQRNGPWVARTMPFLLTMLKTNNRI